MLIVLYNKNNTLAEKKIIFSAWLFKTFKNTTKTSVETIVETTELVWGQNKFE